MERRDDTPAQSGTNNDPYDDEDVRHLGVTRAGTPVFYNGATQEVFGDTDGGEREADRAWTRDVSAEDALADVLEDVGDEFGWDSLTEFAEDHLESDADS